MVWFGLVGVVITNKKGTNSKNALGLKLFRNKFQLNIIYMVWFGMIWFGISDLVWFGLVWVVITNKKALILRMHFD